MVVVKADGYGHGMVPAARAAREAGAAWLGVATLDEALTLRRAGDRGRLLCWLAVPGEDYAAALAEDVEVTAYSVAELDEIAAAARAPRAPGERPAQGRHRPVPRRRGDGRLGRPGRARRVGSSVDGTHRESPASGRTSRAATSRSTRRTTAQEALFAEALAVAEEAGLRPEVRHLANSAAAVLRPSSRYDVVRCGIAAYGLDPAPAARRPPTWACGPR